MPSNLNDTISGKAGKGKLARAVRPRAGGAAAHFERASRTLTDSARETQRLKRAISRRDRHIAMLHENLTGVLHSRSWKLTAPLRLSGRMVRSLRTVVSLLRMHHRNAGGFGPLLRKVADHWRDKGTRGFVDSIRYALGFGPRHTHAVAANQDTIRRQEQPPVFGETSGCDLPPTILFVSHEASRTGAPVLLLGVARLIREQTGLRCLFLLRSGGVLEREFRELGPTMVLPDPNDVDAATLRALSKQNVRLVFSNTATNGLVQRRLKALGRPILCHIHELGHSLERHFGGENLRAVLASTDFFLAGSGAVAEYLLNVRKLPASRVTVAYPFIDVAYNLAQAKVRAVPPLPTKGLIVGACGTIGWRKGTDLFLQLAKQVLSRTGQPVHFVWVGGPLDQGEYTQLAHDSGVMGIRDSVTFTGTVKDHVPIFAQFDIFVLSSREDPFPLVALDAASLGIPVVCFDKAGGTPELVEDDAGVVVPYMDVDGMARAVLELSGDPLLRRRLGDAAAAKVKARYDIAAAGSRIVNLVEARSLQ